VSYHDPDSQRLANLARSQHIDDKRVADAWWGFAEAIDNRWFLPSDLDEILDALRTRQGIGNEEFFFDFDPPGSDEVISRFISDEYRVPADAMIAQVERLRDRYRGGESGPSSSSSSADGGGSAAPRTGASTAPSNAPDLAGFFAGLLGNASSSDAVKNRFAEVSGAISGLVAAMQSNDPAARQRAVADVEALQRSLAASGTDAARWTDAQKAEIARALQAAGGIDTDKLAQGLKTLTTWLEQKTPEAGRAVDAMVESLEKSFGAILTPGKKAAEAERDERIRSDARASIAQRLREAGLKPSGES
jgi:hypothetical protein